MTRATRPVPEGYHTITPYLHVRGATQALDFYRRAFGAEELMRMSTPDGQRLVHAEIRIGDSIVMLADEDLERGARSPQTLGGASGFQFLYVADVDAAFARAVAAGATVMMPVTDMFWGDRFGHLVDPFGHQWGLATHVEDVAPDEIARRAAAAMGATGQAG